MSVENSSIQKTRPQLWFLVVMLLVFMPGAFAKADTNVLRVGLEPFPPLIREDGSGYSIEWLEAVADRAGFKLQVSTMPYSRAKLLLSAGDLDLIAHTPHGLETGNFYEYAKELEHTVPTRMDAFSLDEPVLPKNSESTYVIGTPFGNADFLHELLPEGNFRIIEGALPNLVSMMLAGRIDAVAFERIAVVSEMRKQTDRLIHYRKVEDIDAGFAIRRDDTHLLESLNQASTELDDTSIYQDYSNQLQWPDTGILLP